MVQEESKPERDGVWAQRCPASRALPYVIAAGVFTRSASCVHSLKPDAYGSFRTSGVTGETFPSCYDVPCALDSCSDQRQQMLEGIGQIDSH